MNHKIQKKYFASREIIQKVLFHVPIGNTQALCSKPLIFFSARSLKNKNWFDLQNFFIIEAPEFTSK